MARKWIFFFTFVATLLFGKAQAADAFVYSVYRGVDLGEPNEEIHKDYFVNMGTGQGVREGTILEVSRKMPTYDLMTEKIFKDLEVPFARLRVIYAEKDAAIARLDRIYPADKTPVTTPRAVIVGDTVKPTAK